MKPLAILLRRLPAPGLALAEAQVEMLEAYVAHLLEWNRKVNLISRKDEENVRIAHILHSLAPLFHIAMPERLSVLDIGSGGGLPGIPLAIARSGWRVTLLDSIRKKCVAVEEIVKRLGVSNVNVLTGRAEEKGLIKKSGGRFDVVVARGVAPMADLVRWSRPFLRASDGSVSVTAGVEHTTLPALLAYKGGDLELELKGMRVKERVDASLVVPCVFGGADDGLLQEKKLIVVGLTGAKGARG